MDGLGDRIKLARGARSQEDLAAQLGVDRSTLGSWEIDRREPDIAKLSRLSQILGVSLDWLAGHERSLTIEKSQAYHDSRWYELIDFASTNNIKPEKIKQLIKAALTLR